MFRGRNLLPRKSTVGAVAPVSRDPLARWPRGGRSRTFRPCRFCCTVATVEVASEETLPGPRNSGEVSLSRVRDETVLPPPGDRRLGNVGTSLMGLDDSGGVEILIGAARTGASPLDPDGRGIPDANAAMISVLTSSVSGRPFRQPTNGMVGDLGRKW